MSEVVTCDMTFLTFDSGRPDNSSLIILMFAGILHTMETLTMQFWQAETLEGEVRILLHLPNTETAAGKNYQEQTVIHDVTACCVILRLFTRVFPSVTILQSSVYDVLNLFNRYLRELGMSF